MLLLLGSALCRHEPHPIRTTERLVFVVGGGGVLQFRTRWAPPTPLKGDCSGPVLKPRAFGMGGPCPGLCQN